MSFLLVTSEQYISTPENPNHVDDGIADNFSQTSRYTGIACRENMLLVSGLGLVFLGVGMALTRVFA
ncbi:MAG: hypothetical protein ABJP82_12800 [Hyphomicrobiales bacterium]